MRPPNAELTVRLNAIAISLNRMREDDVRGRCFVIHTLDVNFSARVVALNIPKVLIELPTLPSSGV
jgi:hypothetical protein